MSKHLIKIDNPQHCAISVAHAGLDNQYCEAGEVVAIDWQPSSGWGLQEAHYTDEDGNVVAIDLSVREFTMPAKAIVVSATAKRFVIEDWTKGIGKNTKGTAFNRPTLGIDDAGFEYYDETFKKKILWNGDYWVNVDGTPMPLTFIAAEDASTISLTQVGVATLTDDYEYSLDGLTWNSYTIGDVVTLAHVGDFIQMRGENTATGESNSIYKQFVMTGKVYSSGDVTSLLNGIGGIIVIGSYGLYKLFLNDESLITPPQVPSSQVDSNGCCSMFDGCINLVESPLLAAETLGSTAYASIFNGCLKIVKTGQVRAKVLATNCFRAMFQDCKKVKSYHFATMNGSVLTFRNNDSCAKFVIDDPVPPTLAAQTLVGLKADCIIYVPAGSVDAYKAKQYWSARAAYIQAIP